MINNLKAKWAALNGNIRMIIVALVITVPIGIAFMYFNSSTYQVLYTGLTPEDETAIERHLSDKRIDYRIPAEGTIEVNGEVIKIKRDLALEGLPTGGATSGLDNFGQTSVGSTRYDKDVQYQTGLQKDLNRNITEMFEGVQKAEVKLPKPKEKSIFEDNNEPTEVSVALKLRNGVDLSPEQVSAIQVFVAGAINDVKPENVKVVDSKLNVLSNYDEDAKASNKKQEIAKEVKHQLELQLKETLSRVYGPVEVVANMNINFDEIVQNIKKYDPEGTLLSSERDVETTRQIEGIDSAEPGTDANGEVPNYAIEELEENGNTILAQDKEHIIENFQVSETVEQIIKHPELRNINVAVWVDGNLAEPEIVEMEEMIAIASGLTGTAQRDESNKAVYENGSVKVSQKTFKTQPKDTEEPMFEEEVPENKIPWIVYAIGAGIGLIIFILVLIIALRGRKKDKQLEKEILTQLEGEKEEAKGTDEPKSKEEEELDNQILEGIRGFKIGKLTQQQQDLRQVAGEAASKHAKETADWVRKQLNE